MRFCHVNIRSVLIYFLSGTEAERYQSPSCPSPPWISTLRACILNGKSFQSCQICPQTNTKQLKNVLHLPKDDQEEIQKSELFCKFAFLQLCVSKERTKAWRSMIKNDKNGRYFIFAKLIRTIFFYSFSGWTTLWELRLWSRTVSKGRRQAWQVEYCFP